MENQKYDGSFFGKLLKLWGIKNYTYKKWHCIKNDIIKNDTDLDAESIVTRLLDSTIKEGNVIHDGYYTDIKSTKYNTNEAQRAEIFF